MGNSLGAAQSALISRGKFLNTNIGFLDAAKAFKVSSIATAKFPTAASIDKCSFCCDSWNNVKPVFEYLAALLIKLSKRSFFSDSKYFGLLLEKEIDRVEQKLCPERFTAKAPVEVVEEERAKGEKYKEMYNVVIQSIENLK